MMATRQIDLRHVTSRTVLLRYLARARFCLPAAVTRLTLGVVESLVLRDLLVRVMTGKTRDTPVCQVIALAQR